MLDLGWTELLTIGVVALIVVGPRDLPVLFRNLGRFVAKMKSMAREFQRAMEDAADESGMKETSRDLKSLTSAKNLGLDKLKDVADDFSRAKPGDVARSVGKPGSETEKLARERAAQREKLQEAAAEKAAERRDREPAEPAAAGTAEAGHTDAAEPEAPAAGAGATGTEER